MKPIKPNIAFFDFDGTISQKDSLFLFVKFLVGKKKFYWGILTHLHILLGYLLGVINNAYAKERLSGCFFKDYQREEFLLKCESFLPVLKGILKDSAIKRLQWHQNRGDKVVLVSASFEEYLIPWCREFGIECIATRLEIKDDKISGKFSTPNCYGKEKTRRIQEKYRLDDFDKIYAYGDSKGDREMLELASKECGFYKFFE